MRRVVRSRASLLASIALCLMGAPLLGQSSIPTAGGRVAGTPGTVPGIQRFLGIPYAAAPVGLLRWKAPQPAPSWRGVRRADAFGPRCMQAPMFSDMMFRDTASEDCLYLNVWAPTRRPATPRPVMVWIYGGGFQAGSASEPRQDGERLAAKGVIVVSMNYRVGVFGYLAHPQLTAESGRGASGNYGLMDQVAALRWVHANIAAFGGDPRNVTIFGESAGSFSVSGLMASPLTVGLVHKAIGESGAFFGATLRAGPLTDAERLGMLLADSLQATTVDEMRARSADDVLRLARTDGDRSFGPIIDGYVLPKPVDDLYASGAQHKIPLLGGWNADEIRSTVTLNPVPTTVASFTERLQKSFGPSADALASVYPARTDAEAVESAAALNSDLFIGLVSWRWLEAHLRTGNAAVYRYNFSRKIPVPPGTVARGIPVTAAAIGARHAGEIEYVFGALASVPNVTWEDGDHALSELMMSYWANFATRGDPNGAGLPPWPPYVPATGGQVMHLDVRAAASADTTRARYETLDRAMVRATPR